MNKNVFVQESKEFQLKVVWPTAGAPAGVAEPGAADQQIFAAVSKALDLAIGRLAGGKPYKLVARDNLWRREGIRYDTAGGELKRHGLTLAIEATGERTKLKCKQHHFIPEMLFEKPKKSVCYPDGKKAGQSRKSDCKLKLEQDMHFSNNKYCASGSLFLKGKQTDVDTLGFFGAHFPSLNSLLPADTPLQAVSRWDEGIFDDMATTWNSCEFTTWMLVNRWEWGSGKLLESELSFKVDKARTDPWDYPRLRLASQLYLELQKSGLFLAGPPIFTYDNPVSSRDIAFV